MSSSDNNFICPVCDRPMRLATILQQVPDEETFVFDCRPCGLSTTRTIDAPRQAGHPRELNENIR